MCFLYFLFQLPELQAHHDEAVRTAYASHDLDIEQFKEDAQCQWEARDKTVTPDLALMVRADIHARKLEQRLGRDTILGAQANFLKITGETTLAEDSRQYLVTSVSRVHSRVRHFLCISMPFPSTHFPVFLTICLLLIFPLGFEGHAAHQ